MGEGKLLGFSISQLRFAIQDAFFSILLGGRSGSAFAFHLKVEATASRNPFATGRWDDRFTYATGLFLPLNFRTRRVALTEEVSCAAPC
jgi:hypothetical protein